MTPADTKAEGTLLTSVARHLVDAGRVVPGLVYEPDGAVRSVWWPLPAAEDRPLIAALVRDPTLEGHRAAAEGLGVEVDREVRRRLTEAGTVLVARRPGRRTVGDAWLAALTGDPTTGPRLPARLDPARVSTLVADVAQWVASGAVTLGRARLCLRVHEPDAGSDDWIVELLVQDADEPSLMVPIIELWSANVLFGPRSTEEILTALGRMARVAPELAPLLDEAAPEAAVLDTSTLLRFARERVDVLAEAGVAVLLPSWWARRRRIGLRAKTTARKGSEAAVTAGGVGMDALVAFSWEAALGEQRLTKADLRALSNAADAKQSLVRVRGEWVEVRPGEIEALLARAGTRAEASLAELIRAGLGLDSLDLPDEVHVEGVVDDGWLGAVLDDAAHARVEPIPTPPEFAGALRPYQQRGVGWLAFLGRLGLGACLADDMGLGKTAQLIATILADPVAGPTLVVCPVSVLGNWAAELARFAPQLRVLVHHGSARERDTLCERSGEYDVVLTTYSLIARDLAQLAIVDWARLVLDEAQQVKNPGTAQTRAVTQLRASRRVAMTGTPVENRLAELWSLMHILNPGLLGTSRSFRERFAVPIERDGDEDAAALLRRVTGPFVLRRLKSDPTIIDDLPDKIELTEHCPLTREQVTLYQAVVDELLEAAENTEGIGRRGAVLAGLTKLKQVCNHPAHFLRDGSALGGRSGKLTRVEELLDEIVDAGDKVLCFTQFAEWGELLVPHLAARYGRAPAWLHGGVRRTVRDKMVAEFAEPSGPQIFLLSLKAGGTGLNLTAASHVIHLDRWWNPAVEDQATDRAYRIGQQHTVLVHKLVSRGTVEERIDAMINTKRALAERVVGAGEQWVTELSTDDLRDAVALRAPEDEG
ncbi:MAG: DEAD/DEAH box helicase [Acidimicrobiales bacterium]